MPIRVTITGADNAVDPSELVRLSGSYPFVEWGILHSKKREGSARYPDRDWIAHLGELAHPWVYLSVHLCGAVARDMIEGSPGWPSPFLRVASPGRLQINGYDGHLSPQVGVHGMELILQVRDADRLPEAATRALALPNASILYDPSGGRGLAPEVWPVAPAGVRMGIAGGITPETALATARRAQQLAASWIDMESGVRSDDCFDLDKVRAVLDACAGRSD